MALSNNLAEIVEQVGSAVVAFNAGRRFSPSGILWREGIIVTSDESLHRYDDITVTLASGSTVPVTLLGRDSSTDVAVFQVENQAQSAKIGDATTLEVLEMLGSGMGNKAIAKHLQISEHTVKFHLSSIFQKLGVATRTEAVSLGVRLGLIML